MLARLSFLALALVPLACDPGGMADAPDDDGSAMLDDEEPEARGCAAETRADTYTLGMAKSGERLQVAFVEALPAPPARGDNTWTVAISDGAGAPMVDLPIEVEPYMPDHMHGSSIPAHVSATEIAGEYLIEPVDLFMPGLWQVTLYLTLPDGTEDEVEFDFCVDP